MANATILSIAGVSVTASGGHTGDKLAQVASVFSAASTAGSLSVTTLPAGVQSNPTLPAAPPTTVPGEVQVLVIPSTYTGAISVPSGYGYVVYNGSGQLTGADGKVVVGDLNYSGGASTVLATGGTGQVSDTVAGAVLSFFAGTYTAVGTGANQSLVFDGAANFAATMSGSNSSAVIGATGSVPAQTLTNFLVLSGASESVSALDATNYISANGLGGVVSVAGGSTTVVMTGGSTTLDQTAGSLVGALLAGGMTFNGNGGSSTLFDKVGGSTINGGLATEYVGTATNVGSTFTAMSAAADTIFAGASMTYQGSGAASTFFAGGTGTAAVIAGAKASVFGGSGGGSYYVGGNSFFFIGAGAAAQTTDNVFESGNSASGFIWGNSNETLSISSIAGAASVKGASIVAYGNNDSINASAAGAGNTFFYYNLAPGSLPMFSGDSTLVGSSAGHDNFNLFVDSTQPSAAHTVTINNWQSSDTMFINNLASGSDALTTADSAIINTFLAGSSNSFTLTDGTTVVFNGAKPTNIAHV